MAHTPGPWAASERAHTAEPDHTYWHIESNEVDGVTAVNLAGFLSAEGAHLIAAAPDMLAALKSAREFIVIECGEKAPYVKIALTRIEAAIARAEGRAP